MLLNSGCFYNNQIRLEKVKNYSKYLEPLYKTKQESGHRIN